MKKIITLLLAGATFASQAQMVYIEASFDTIRNVSVPTGGYLNGSGKSVEGFFESGNVQFPNMYSTAYGGYWVSGWAYSSIQNDTVAGYTDLYASYAASGNNNSSNYAVGQAGSVLRNINGDTVSGLYATNGTYAALSMKNGDGFAKKFGGTTGDDADYFVLTVKAWKSGTLKSDSVNFYLADYRDANNSNDYIVKDWTFVDLQSLGAVDSLLFELSSSDNGAWGMNTPAFFCVDDVVRNNDTADFENLLLFGEAYWNKTETTLYEMYEDAHTDRLKYPSAYTTSAYGDYWSSGYAISNVFDTVTSGYENLYATYAGKIETAFSGAWNKNFAVLQNHTTMNFSLPDFSRKVITGQVFVSNTTYAALSMKNGDGFAKKFGGVSGDDPDYFLLTIKGYADGNVTDSVNFYLADYRDADNSKDYIVKDWTRLDLRPLGLVDSIEFVLSSSDNGAFGMNTPAFFCIDQLIASGGGAVHETNKTLSFSVYPNPANEYFQVKTEAAQSTVRVLDIAGREVATQKIKGNEKVFVNQLPAGLYWVEVKNEDGVGVRKLIKD